MSNDWQWYVYILLCDDGSYYTGVTSSPDKRMFQHFDSYGSKYTAKFRPKKLLYIKEFDNLDAARMREKQIKGWSRKKKEKLIKHEWV